MTWHMAFGLRRFKASQTNPQVSLKQDGEVSSSLQSMWLILFPSQDSLSFPSFSLMKDDAPVVPNSYNALKQLLVVMVPPET